MPEFYLTLLDFTPNSNYLPNGDMEADSYWQGTGGLQHTWEYNTDRFLEGQRSLKFSVGTPSWYDLTTDFSVGGVDSAELTITSEKVSWSDFDEGNEAWLAKDFGSGALGNFKFTFEMVCSGMGADSRYMVCGVSNTLGSFADNIAANDGILITIRRGDNYYQTWIWEGNSFKGSSVGKFDTDDNGFGPKYVTFTRSGDNLSFDVFDDAAKTIVNSEFTIDYTCTQTAFRYFYAFASREAGSTLTDGYSQRFSRWF